VIVDDFAAVGTTLPLMFSFRHTLFGNGFAVEVRVKNGRALCVHEEDGVWLYGVNPGGMSAFGHDSDQARAAFRKTFSRVLIDLATEAKDFEQFKASVGAFFDETNEGYEPEWYAAVQHVRDQHISAAGLPSISAEAPRSVDVTMKQIFQAQDNEPDLKPALAA
jgi:hypothetical protein